MDLQFLSIKTATMQKKKTIVLKDLKFCADTDLKINFVRQPKKLY